MCSKQKGMPLTLLLRCVVMSWSATASVEKVISSTAATQISKGGVHLEEAFAPLRLVEDLRSDVRALKKAGLYAQAGSSALGYGESNGMRLASFCDPVDRNRSVGDWFAFVALWERLDMVRQQLEDELQVSLLQEIEIHYVQYPKGGFYRRHVDDFDSAEPRSSRRHVAFICYLTPLGWRPADGGALRVFVGDKHTDIQPSPGTLVLFDAFKVQHEVLPTARERDCLVGWFHISCAHNPLNCPLPAQRSLFRHVDLL